MTTTPIWEWALNAAIDKLGSQGAMARLLGVTQPTVWKWVHSTKRVPAKHILAVEAATGISRHDLDPDIYPRDSGQPGAQDRLSGAGPEAPAAGASQPAAGEAPSDPPREPDPPARPRAGPAAPARRRPPPHPPREATCPACDRPLPAKAASR